MLVVPIISFIVFFSLQYMIQSRIVHILYWDVVSLLSFNLEYFLSLSLSYMTFTFWSLHTSDVYALRSSVFSLLNNLWGNFWRSCKYSASYQAFSSVSSIHWWFLLKPIFTMTVIKWWLSNSTTSTTLRKSFPFFLIYVCMYVYVCMPVCIYLNINLLSP